MTQRTHLSASAKPITLHAVDQDASPGASYKPAGFWYEVDGDWRRWREEENWGPERGHLHALELNDCNVLQLTTLQELDDFDVRWGSVHKIRALNSIDWPALAREYDGLEIAPYQWARRLDFMWYYGWDCASGVIWRPRGARVTYLGPVEALGMGTQA